MTGRTRAGRASVQVLVGLLVAAALAACSSIPTSGPIRVQDDVAGTEEQPVIRVLARPPRDGAGPAEIVTGFLTASGSFENDHAVARQFLTSAASGSWRPQSRVAVYESDAGYRLAPVGADRVRMTAAQRAGTISARGELSQPPPGSEYRTTFTVTRVDGQWRIAALPQGLVLGTDDVRRAYRATNLYFADPAGGVLVPDPVFLPTQQTGVATSAVRELLRGPTAWLAPVVRSAFPTGTQLAVDSVPVEDNVARVDLDTAALSASAGDRRILAAQLTFTLVQLPDVAGVRITVRGIPFPVAGIGEVSRPSDWEAFDPSRAPRDAATYAVTTAGLATVGSTVAPVAGFFGSARGLQDASVALDGSSTAGTYADDGGVVVRRGAIGVATARTLLRGTGVSRLSHDRFRTLWFADRLGGTTRMWAAPSDRAPVRVPVVGLDERSVSAVRVARDGVRVALVVSAPGGSSQLLLGRVDRSGRTPAVSGLRRAESALAAVADVAWADDSTLLAVARRADEPLQGYTIGLDGASLLSVGAVPSMRTVAACPDRPFLAGNTDGQLWVDRGSGWQAYVRALTPIYPG